MANIQYKTNLTVFETAAYEKKILARMGSTDDCESSRSRSRSIYVHNVTKVDRIDGVLVDYSSTPSRAKHALTKLGSRRKTTAGSFSGKLFRPVQGNSSRAYITRTTFIYSVFRNYCLINVESISSNCLWTCKCYVKG